MLHRCILKKLRLGCTYGAKNIIQYIYKHEVPNRARLFICFLDYLYHHIHNTSLNHNNLFRLFAVQVTLHIGISQNKSFDIFWLKT